MAHPAQFNWEAARATEWENAMVSSNEIRNDLFISFPKTTPKLLSTGRTNSAALSFQYVRVLRRVILDTPAYFPYQMSAQKAIWASNPNPPLRFGKAFLSAFHSSVKGVACDSAPGFQVKT
jgi:hypothetical protein